MSGASHDWQQAFGGPDQELQEQEHEPTYCPACGGDGGSLGTLGRVSHFRCIDCGLDFSNERKAQP